MDAGTPVYVITGQLSAGKSTVAEALLQRFGFGLHIDVDGIREMVVSGRASPLEWSDETTRQFELAIRASAAMAGIYVEAGFAVVIEGGMDAEMVEQAMAEAGIADRLIGVVLQPRLEVALERNRTRTSKAFDTGILEGVMREIGAGLTEDGARDRWHRIDNSDEPVEATVDRILSIGQ